MTAGWLYRKSASTRTSWIDKALVLRNLWIKYRMTMGNLDSTKSLKGVYDYVLESKNLDIEFTKHLILCTN